MMRKSVGGRLGLVSLKGHLQPTSSSLFHFHANEEEISAILMRHLLREMMAMC